MAGLVLREDRDGLATLTLNRPEKLNSINLEMFVELRGHVDQIAHEIDRVGLVVVRGAGKCFSAGHDLADIAKGERPPQAELSIRDDRAPRGPAAACYFRGAWALLHRRAGIGAGGRSDRRGGIGEIRRHSCAMGADSDLGDDASACRDASVRRRRAR